MIRRIPKLCQACKKRDALVFLWTSVTSSTGTKRRRGQKRFCRQCADDYRVRTGMNSSRDLIRLSDFYRFKLYDLLEERHPEVFDNSTSEACAKGSELMRRFLRERLRKDQLKLRGDAFEMLFHDFIGSRHFYDRIDKLKTKKSVS
jgi:hypothetical protein